jgi:alkaline phosphatase
MKVINNKLLRHSIVKYLSKNKKKDKAHKSLDDYVMFDDAIGEALKLVSLEDTMIVVTADHSHTFTIGGNSNRGNPVYGVAVSYKTLSDVNLTFTSILYGNGPGGLLNIRKYNLTNSITG